jgi:D-hydroxyproline dehydrogenase subunit beta
MPDVIVVGGGVIGAACADELARRGMSVTLFERDALAAAASGRNMGLWLPPEDLATQPMGRRSIETYLTLAADSPSPFRLDRAPIGYLLLAIDPEDVQGGAETAQAIASAGVEVHQLDADALHDREPAFAPGLAAAWWIDDGHRLDPGALTVALATRAAAHGAAIRHHTAVHALLERSDRVVGVMTDDGPAEADHVVLAAGPWTPALCEPLGLAPPITGAVGWVVRVGPVPGGPTTLMESVGWRHHADGGPSWPTAHHVARRGLGGFQSAPALHPHDDGSVTIGAMRQPWLTPEPPDPSVVRTLLADAIRVAPAIADAPVRASRWCVRPTTPDERPLIGELRDGLWIAGGHGSEGVILGGGSALLLGAMLTGDELPFDAAPFAPDRFA